MSEITTPPLEQQASSKEKAVFFPVGPAGKRELRNALKQTSNPQKTIAEFQKQHSLHTMMTKAFGTVPQSQFKSTRSSDKQLETLDTDSVVTFLHHLGIPNHDFHKRISDSLLKSLEDKIRSTTQQNLLLELLKNCWVYATTIPELRPVLWAVLRQLGAHTPLPVLLALVEKDSSTETLKHAEIFQPLPLSLKRLCWEADWDNRVPEAPSSDPQQYLNTVKATLFYETIQPHVDAYLRNSGLVDVANRVFVNTPSERKLLTTQRRALAKPSSTTAGAGFQTGPCIAHMVRMIMGEASSRGHVANSTAANPSQQRPKLLYGILSILMARHGTVQKIFMGGADHLHCTLLADLLLSTSGPLPKAYNHLLSLARTLDDTVQEGTVSDKTLAKLQEILKSIFQFDSSSEASTPKKPAATSAPSTDVAPPTPAVQRQLNRIITSGLTALKEADPQKLFFYPVADEVAFGYSKIIKQPMSISTMEEKLAKSSYLSVYEWQSDVHLMFRNCEVYNKGPNGKWFRDEAKRQAKVFRDEVFPQARRLYQNELAKRKVVETTSGVNVRKDGPDITPLEPSSKKRKKEKEPYLPSIPALASMLLCDPFVVRIVVARVLREVRVSVLQSNCLPVSHEALPSLLQLLHIAYWSKDMCAIFGKKFFIPSAGLQEGEDPSAILSHKALRRYLPLLMRLLLTAELDKRVAQGGDLYEVSQSAFNLELPEVEKDAWKGSEQLDVTVALVEGALVQLCEPGQKNELSLAGTYTKFATALSSLSQTLEQDRGFFVSLSTQLLRHKTRLPKDVRDAVFKCWCSWLETKDAMFSPCHSLLIELLIDWSSLGNVLLPRDALIQFSQDVVAAVDAGEKDETKKFRELWQSNADEFLPVKKLYERILKQLPESFAAQWKDQVGIVDTSDPMETEEPAVGKETVHTKNPTNQ